MRTTSCFRFFQRAVFGCVLACLALVVSAQEHETAKTESSEPFTLEQILSSPFPSSLVAAKSGTRIAWVFEQQGRRSIWVAEGPDFEARSIIEFPDDDGQPVSIIGFTADSEYLVFLRGSTSNAGHDHAGPVEPALWRIGFTDGKPVKLVVADNGQINPRVLFSFCSRKVTGYPKKSWR